MSPYRRKASIQTPGVVIPVGPRRGKQALNDTSSPRPASNSTSQRSNESSSQSKLNTTPTFSIAFNSTSAVRNTSSSFVKKPATPITPSYQPSTSSFAASASSSSGKRFAVLSRSSQTPSISTPVSDYLSTHLPPNNIPSHSPHPLSTSTSAVPSSASSRSGLNAQSSTYQVNTSIHPADSSSIKSPRPEHFTAIPDESRPA